MSSKEPVFNVPAAVVAVLALMAAVHVGRQLLDPETGNWLIAAFAFIPWRYAGGAEQLPGGYIATATSFVTHMFLHGDATHLLLNSAWMLVFGGAVAKRIGGPLFLAFTAWTGAAGALVFLLFNFGLLAPVIGASGAVSGLMGATMRFLFSALDDGGVAQLRDRPHTVRLMGLRETLSDRRVQFATAIWLLLNGLAAFGISTEEAAGAIAWEAHIGGFVAGLLTFGWFDAANAKAQDMQPSFD